MPSSFKMIFDKPIAYEVAAYLSCCAATCLLMYFIILADVSN